MTGSVDDHGRQAAHALHDEVARQVDTEAALATVAAGRIRSGRRWPAMAAVAVLLAGAIGLMSGGDGGREILDTDPDRAERLLEDAALTLTPAGPRDGKDSLMLPVTADPSTGLREGDSVTVRGEGFVPGESVGIVQCAIEAAQPDRGGMGAGVDACNIGRFEQVAADDAGVATGTFRVYRALSTSIAGTVDCASAPERCIVAMGALSDYDRSGGIAISFDPEGLPPLQLPTVEVTPAAGLADGDTVSVTGTGFRSDATVHLELCSLDPATCWMVGEPIEVTDAPDCPECSWFEHGLQADADGNLAGDVQVWRYLPGVPGSYVDCAVSTCVLRASGPDLSAPPAPLAFDGGGEPPSGAVLAVTPSEGVAAGDEVEILGAGFAPGADVYLQLCASHADTPVGPDGATYPEVCYGLDEGTGRSFFGMGGRSHGSTRVDDDGSFQAVVRLPDLGTTGRCLDPECREMEERRVNCADAEWTCDVRSEVGWEPAGRPIFHPAPVVLRYR
jgi:hypothetical protein